MESLTKELVKRETFSEEARLELEAIERKLDLLRSDPEFVVSWHNEPYVCDLVLSGGGAKGVADIGALWAFDRLGIRFKRLAGTSAGAIMAAIVASGLTISEISSHLMKADFMTLKDVTWDQYLPMVANFARIAAVPKSFGLYEGTGIQSWLHRLLALNNAETFGKLPKKAMGMLAELNEEDGSRLQIMASDLTHTCELMMPRDLSLERYGSLDPEGFLVSTAVRMSVSLPFFFKPFKLGDSLIVDGAFASNLPLETFDREDTDNVRWPTFGINLVSDPTPPNPATNLYNFGLALFETMRHGYSKMSFLQYPTRICRLIDIPTSQVRTLDFDISPAKRERLFLNGANSVLKTMRGNDGAGIRTTWNFERYLKLRQRWSFDPIGPIGRDLRR